MQRPTPTFLGYLARDIFPAEEYLANSPEKQEAGRRMGLRELCSVSACISDAYRDMNRWRFNSAGFYKTSADAREVVPAMKRDTARIFGYRLFPLCFEGESSLASTVTTLLGCKPTELPEEPGAEAWGSIGYDVVSMRPGEGTFALDCSPLSCNLMFMEHPVNAHCLIESWDAAVAAAGAFAKDEPEPGPYCIMEVLEGLPVSEQELASGG